MTRLPPSRRPKSWDSVEEPVVPLERNLYGHPLAAQLQGRRLDVVLFQATYEKPTFLGIVFTRNENRNRSCP